MLLGYFLMISLNGMIFGMGVSVSNMVVNVLILLFGLLLGQLVLGFMLINLSGNVSGVKLGVLLVYGGLLVLVDLIIVSVMVLNVLNNFMILQGGLYWLIIVLNVNYVIEMNLVFMNQKNFILSDYFFGQFGIDFMYILKCFGDGFYEQQLVCNQVMVFIGKVVLGLYVDLQMMYQLLMMVGVDLLKLFDLLMGVSLLVEQVLKLISNVIMMEMCVIDGQLVFVLVVYFVQVNQQNVNGLLISVMNFDFQNVQLFMNSGMIKVDNMLVIQGKQIDNVFGVL